MWVALKYNLGAVRSPVKRPICVTRSARCTAEFCDRSCGPFGHSKLLVWPTTAQLVEASLFFVREVGVCRFPGISLPHSHGHSSMLTRDAKTTCGRVRWLLEDKPRFKALKLQLLPTEHRTGRTFFSPSQTFVCKVPSKPSKVWRSPNPSLTNFTLLRQC